MSPYTYKTTILSRMMNEKRGNFMANEQEPRNELGQTYDEWVEYQRQSLQEIYGEVDLEPWDIIVGIDSERNVKGVRLSDMGIIVGRVTRPISPVATGYSQQAMAQYGATFQGISYGTKTFQIPITIKADSKEQYNARARALANLIIMPDNQSETSIVFGEEPDIVYYGHFENIPDPQPLTDTGWDYGMTLSFVATDPRGFFNTKNEVVDMSHGEINLIPKGTAYADPVITIKPKDGAKPLTQFGYTINAGEKVTAGLSTNSIKMFDTKPAVFIDEMNDMGNWQQIKPPLSNPNSVLGWKLARNDTLTDGTIGTNPSSRGAITNAIDGSKQASWTTKPDKFKPYDSLGPVAISKTNMATTIGKNGNWETAIKLHNVKRYSRALEGLEIYLLDDKGKRRARFGQRAWAAGERAHAWIRFGKDYDDETKAVQTGLGMQKDDNGLDGDFINKQDVNVPIWNGVNIPAPYTTSKTTTTYNYVSQGDTKHKITETWTVTQTTTYDPQTKKYKTNVVYSPLDSTYNKNANNNMWTNYTTPSKHNDFRYISKWEDFLKLAPAKVHYWKKGQPKRYNDYGGNGIIPKQYYKNNTTPGKVPLKNYCDITIKFEYMGNNLMTNTEIVKLHYTNGNGERKKVGGFRYISNFGYLQNINFSYKTASSSNKRDKTQHEMVDYPDKGEAGTYDDAFILVTIGKDDNGFYWQIDKLNTDGNSKQVSLVPREYDKRPDLHSAYDFTPDKIAIHFFKYLQQEDRNVWKEGDETTDDVNYKPAKKYADNYMSVYDVRVYKLLDPPDYADLINLKPGQTAQFNTENNTLTIDGKLRQELVNPDSTFPQIRGGVPNNIRFFPNPGNDYDIKLSYRPTIL